MNNNFLLSLFCAGFFCFLAPLQAQDNNSALIDFIKDDYAKAKAASEQSGKLLLVKFTARWCMPCKMMNEYVWNDPTLVNLVQQNCVALSADFDKFDNFPIREGFDVETLPTVLILSSKGEELKRFISSCTATQIIDNLYPHLPSGVDSNPASYQEEIVEPKVQQPPSPVQEKVEVTQPVTHNKVEKKEEKVQKVDTKTEIPEAKKEIIVEAKKEEENVGATEPEPIKPRVHSTGTKLEKPVNVTLKQPVIRKRTAQRTKPIKAIENLKPDRAMRYLGLPAH